MNSDDELLLRCGFRGGANSVRIALGLPPHDHHKHEVVDKRYLTGDDREERIDNTQRMTPLMVGLALGGVRSPYIATIAGCSESAVRGRLRAFGVSHPRGNLFQKRA